MADVTLRPYQQKAVDETLRHLKAGDSTVLVAPTGAGKTIMGAAIAQQFKKVMIIAHRRELVKQAREVFGWRVCAHSVQGLAAGKRRRDFIPNEIDLLVIDEAHRSAASLYRRIIAMYPKAVILGLTATPKRTDGKGLRDAFSRLVVCSNVKELVTEGHLVPYRALEAPDEALNQLPWMKKSHGDYATKELSDLMNKPRLVGSVVREYQKHANGRKAICFAVSVEHSKALADAFKAAGIRAAHIDGRTSDGLRNKLLNSLSVGAIDVLCNVELFTEGWNCPPVSCVIMARPTASLTLYLQCVGRGMRAHPGKEDLLILDHAGNIQRHDYPDEAREWSLEGDAERAKREKEEAQLALARDAGFESIEAWLEDRSAARASSYLLREVTGMIAPYVGHIKQVGSFLNRHGIPRTAIQQRYDKSAIHKLLANLKNSYQKTTIATLMGCSAQTAIYRLKKAGIAAVFGVGTGTRYPKDQVDELVSRLAECYRISEAKSVLGYKSAGSMWTYLQKSRVDSPWLGLYKKCDIDRLAEERKNRQTVKRPATASAAA